MNPDYKKLTDPFALTGMNEAVQIIAKSIEKKEKIVVYGDYDVDGISGTAILLRFFGIVGAKAEGYIPSRADEGYGLNAAAIKKLAKEGVKLIVTTDCGTSAEDEIRLCHELGLKIVITDHHEPRKLTVKPEAIVNPKNQPDKSFTNLAGAGVAFYLARALQSRYPDQLPSGQEKWFLDLAALGTICDIVPLIDDNRIIAKFGLTVLSKSRNIGLLALAKISGFELANIDTYKVGFLLGPRLNAAGRLVHAKEALELLLTEERERAEEIAKKLSQLNEERQELTERIVTEAKEMIDKGEKAKRKILILKNKNWPAGVVGIAASRLVEEYARPVLIMEEGENELKGSARSIRGFNIVEALNSCSDCFLHFGGHAQAAGFRLEKGKFLLLDEKLIKISEEKIDITDLVPELLIESNLSNKIVDQKLADALVKMEPFGTGNPRPVFRIEKAIIKEANLVGKDKNHLKLVLEKNNNLYNAIAFFYGENHSFKKGETINVAFTIGINEWNKRKKIDLHLLDIK